MEAVVELVLGHARRGARVTVHGDYDVDGVSSTAILVRTLRELGADCDWLIPDRMGDGYGLSAGSVEELKRRRHRAGRSPWTAGSARPIRWTRWSAPASTSSSPTTTSHPSASPPARSCIRS